MSASLVGSEMCIRDSCSPVLPRGTLGELAWQCTCVHIYRARACRVGAQIAAGTISSLPSS
eukprot:4687039-Alexandrium_andersonii.AAC.1